MLSSVRRLALLLVAVVLLHPTASVAAAPSPFPCGLAAGGWLSEGPTNRAAHLASVGTVRATMVLVDFPDHPATTDPRVTIDGDVKDAQRWWAEVSYGRFQAVFDAPPRWFRMPAPMASYGMGASRTFETHRRYLADAVGVADPDVDFSRTQLFFVVSPPASGLGGSSALVAPSGLGIVADGAELRFGANLGDDGFWGATVHETGHTMGLPDLYDLKTHAIGGAGAWDTMSLAAGVAHFVAWQKWKLGWLDDGQVTCLGRGRREITLTPLETKGGMKAVVIPTGRSTAIVAEVRARVGRDTSRCDEGVLVYAVDTSRATGAYPIQVRSAHPELERNPKQRCQAFTNAPFDLGKGENPTFTDQASRTTIQVVKNDHGNRTIVVTKG
jgi:M6 family metalloprotease-like protein